MFPIILFAVFLVFFFMASGSFISLLSTDGKIRRSAGLLLCGSIIAAGAVAAVLKFVV